MRSAGQPTAPARGGTAPGRLGKPPSLLLDPQAADPVPIRLALDDDDDDDDRYPDLERPNFASNELIPLEIDAHGQPVTVKVRGGVRLLARSKGALARSEDAGAAVVLTTPHELPARGAPATLYLQGVRVSTRPHDASLVLLAGTHSQHLPITVVRLGFLDARNHALVPMQAALGVSRRITNDASLPRGLDYQGNSEDPENVRVQLVDPGVHGSRANVILQSVDLQGRVRDQQPLVLERPHSGLPFRSSYVRLVSDRIDRSASGVADQVLMVALRDRVRIRYGTGTGATHDLAVGRPGDERGPRAARLATLRVRILRTRSEGNPVVGQDDESGTRIAREQVAIANEIWLQCFITFGPPELADVEIVDPPPPALISVGDTNGLPAAGGGRVRFSANGRPIQPVLTRPRATPTETALQIAAALRRMGLRPRVTVNARTEFGADNSADVVVRDRDGNLVGLEPLTGIPLNTDPQQSMVLAHIDLGDGVGEFNNMTAAAGTLEERALIKSLADGDPSTIDLLIVNRFSHGTRQGEAFIEGSRSALVNTVLIDRNGLRQQRTAWTLAHELGHVLLNQPFHPDNVGADRPWLLMDSDNNQGTVTGPKRVPWSQCQRALVESGPSALPPLLRPYQERQRQTPERNAKR